MAPGARDRSISRRSWLLAGLTLPLFRGRAANPPIGMAYDGDDLRPVAPNVHFLSGKALERLRDGNTVEYRARLSLCAADQIPPLREVPGTFQVSYDILEERFQVVIPGSNRRVRSGLTSLQAEAWCLENLPVSAAGLAPERVIFLRLEIWAAAPRSTSPVTDPPLSVKAIIELLSRKAGPGDPHWGPYESARQRLSELGRQPGRGARSG